MTQQPQQVYAKPRLPRAFLTTTKKGKDVFRIHIERDKFLTSLEEGKTMMAIDIPAPKGNISISTGFKNGKQWKGITYYDWAVKPQEKTNGK